MKRLTITLLALVAIICSTVAANKWDLKVSDNQRYLQYSDGTPFFWLGDTGWLLPEKLDRDQADGYLNTCEMNGYNVVQVQTINAVPSVNVYGQLSNISKQSPWDFSGIDREGVYGYWDHMDYIIKCAERHHIYIAMTCIWGGLVKEGLLDVEGAKAYGRFLAERYKDAPNIIWFIGGDIQGDVKAEVWNTLAETIKSIDKRHLMTYHPRGRYTSAKWWSGAAWMDFHMYQSGHRKYGQRLGNKDYPIPDNTEEDCWMYVDSTWAYKPMKPVIDGEPSYEDIPKGLHFPKGERWQPCDIRRYAYWDVFAGCFGHTYGHNAIMQMARGGDWVNYSENSKSWYEAQNDPGYIQMKYLKALMLTLPFFDRVPDQTIIYRANGTQYDRLIATRGNDYLLVYNYNGNEMNIDLTKVSGKKKQLWWMNAKDGQLTYLGVMDSKKIKQTVPASVNQDSNSSSCCCASGPLYDVNDGVLIAIDADKNYLTNEQTNILDAPQAGKKDMTE